MERIIDTFLTPINTQNEMLGQDPQQVQARFVRRSESLSAADPQLLGPVYFHCLMKCSLSNTSCLINSASPSPVPMASCQQSLIAICSLLFASLQISLPSLYIQH